MSKHKTQILNPSNLVHQIMSTTSQFLPFLLLLLIIPATSSTAKLVPQPKPDPYFSKNTLFTNYNSMLSNLKIFIYPSNFSETLPQPLSTFHTSLLNSNFLTRDPTRATLFYLPFTPKSTRSLARYVDNIRTSYPFWDRSLGADHFYLTCHDEGPTSGRNVVELRKNAVQVTCFPSTAREFVPHKDVTLPPYLATSRAGSDSHVTSMHFLGYLSYFRVGLSGGLIQGLKNDVDFLVQSQSSDDDRDSYSLENMSKSKFCLFLYNDMEGMRRLGVALAQGCVPVVITDHPIQDFPLIDVIRWSEIAFFVRSNMGLEKMKSVLSSTCEEGGGYETMRRLGMAAAHHMMWGSEESSDETLGAFQMVVYQLWLRRHAISYERWEGGVSA